MTLSDRDGWLWPDADTELWKVALDYTILEMAFVECRHRRTAIQAGGACGTFPRWLSERFSMVYTFEPDPVNFTCLAANCQQPNVVKMQAALGHCTVRMGLEREKPDNAGAAFIDKGDGVQVIPGDIFELNDVDLIQLDCEGMEYHALYGLRQTIDLCSPVIALEQKHSLRYGVAPEEIVAFLEKLGYRQCGTYARDLVFRRSK